MGVAVQIADGDDRRDAVLIEALAEALIAPELTESRRVLMRERVLAAAGDSAPPLTDGAQRPKQIGCLSRQRDQVRFASFHAFARNYSAALRSNSRHSACRSSPGRTNT